MKFKILVSSFVYFIHLIQIEALGKKQRDIDISNSKNNLSFHVPTRF